MYNLFLLPLVFQFQPQNDIMIVPALEYRDKHIKHTDINAIMKLKRREKTESLVRRTQFASHITSTLPVGDIYVQSKC